MRSLGLLFSAGMCAGFVAIAGARAAGPDDFISRLWQMEDGLPHNNVESVAQTRDGYLWVGTTAGLARFDGARFAAFDTNNAPALGHSYIRVVRLARDGSLWIGTAGGTLAQWKEGQFTAFDPGESNLGNIFCLFQSADGAMWAGSNGGLLRWTGGEWTRFTTADGLPHNSVRALCEFGGELVAATDRGPSVFKEGRFVELNPPGSGPARYLRALWPDREGRLWLGFRYGLGVIEAHGGFRLFTRKDGLPDENETVVYEDRQANLWIGSMGGLSRMRDGQFLAEQQADGSSYGRVRCVFEDREGTIWVGTRDGLSQLRTRRFRTYNTHDGLAHNNVMSVLEDRQGTIWCAMWGGGLARMQDGKIVNYSKVDPQPNMLTTDNLLSLFEDQDGTILAGVDYVGGVFGFRNGTFTQPMPPIAELTDQPTRVIFRDRRGALWLGLNSGLVRWDTREKWLRGIVVRDITEDEWGRLWIGTAQGLYRFDDGTLEQFSAGDDLSSDRVSALFSAAGELWIGTENGGLNRLKDGRLTTYTRKEGMFSDQIGDIIEDDEGWLWFTSMKGIFRVRKNDFDRLDSGVIQAVRCIAYGREDGLATVQCNDFAKPAAWRGRDGRLWFATTKGLAVINPRLAGNLNVKPAPVLIEELVAGNKAVYTRSVDRAESASAIQVPPGRGDLEIRYTGLSLQVPERVRFRYRLAGRDADWLDAGDRRSVYYGNLRPGEYRFQVTACNSDGVWNEIGDSLAFVVLPHFWQTWWFVSLMVAVSLGAVGGAARYATRRRMQRKLERLEQQNAVERERARIARDMHDELGAKLTRISFQGATASRSLPDAAQARQHIVKMSETARELVASLDQIVWAVDPENDSLDNLANYICRYASDFVESSAIQCELVIPTELPHHRLSTEVRHNVFLAVKEALNNALKHSGATRVVLTIAVRTDEFEVRIADNGRGMAEARDGSTRNERTGRGLANMRERMASIQGRFELDSAPERGTEVRLIGPLARRGEELSSIHPTRKAHP